ncbi:MAG TPA: protein-L-isoaspartate O-methyltransferase, partial [Caldimonas sp.]|nr:protein-L-isoaspartate O-methyltransferase [Caldimonas sp.]
MTAEGRPRSRFPLRLDRLPAVGSPGGTVLRPQRDLAAAYPDAGRSGSPAGLGLDSIDVRRRMVERLRDGGVGQSQVIEALLRVPRHSFVDTALATQAYEDTSLPIGHGQTISKPSVVARMLEMLFEGTNARRHGNLGAVLEIGTGCGYQAALLSELSVRVISMERLKPLHEKARDLLAPIRSNRLRLVHGDGMLGHPPNAPYDSIIAAAGGAQVPEAWLDQLAVGGRLVSPVDQADGSQALVVVDRRE